MKTVEQRASAAIISCIVAVLCCAPARLSAAPAEYQPQVIYRGEFIPAALYYKNPESSVWQRMSKSDNYLDVVRCPAALRALNSAGQWQGHLDGDGSCGPADEPSLFAIGNRINSDAIAAGEEPSK